MDIQALEKVVAEVPGCPGLVLGSSCQRSTQRRRAFMKKLLTVESSSPSCCEMVSCISLLGRLFSLKMAMSVRRCRSVKTSRCFLGARLRSLCCSCSFLLQANTKNKRVTDTLNRNTNKATNQNIDCCVVMCIELMRNEKWNRNHAAVKAGGIRG